jgi:hypothetical protein
MYERTFKLIMLLWGHKLLLQMDMQNGCISSQFSRRPNTLYTLFNDSTILRYIYATYFPIKETFIDIID